MHWWFPENASSYGREIDNLFLLILYITGAVFFLVEITLLVFLVKYRKREGRKATYIDGSTRAEIIWTAAFRIKQDAVPGLTIRAWFRPTRTGEYELGCAELCGLGHYRMKTRVFVHTAAEFAAWQTSQVAPPADTATAAPAPPPPPA